MMIRMENTLGPALRRLKVVGRVAGMAAFRPRLDLPLYDTPASRLLTALVAACILISTLAFAAAIAADAGLRAPQADGGAAAAAWRLLGSVLGLVGLLAAVASGVVPATHLADPRDGAVGLLRLIGAPTAYLAGQYQRFAFSCAVRGAAVGFLVAVLGLASAGLLGATHLPGGVPLDLRPGDWALLTLAPVLTPVVTGAATRRLAARRLARRL